MFVNYSPSPETASLVIPKNVFEMQDKMSSNLNKFQTHYGRYMRCQNEYSAKDVNPPCDYTGEDSFSELQNAYRNLINDLNELEDVYENQSSIEGKTVKVYQENQEQLKENYDELLNIRQDLDNKLKQIQEYSESKLSPEQARLKSVNLINTLLVITMIYLIYVIFTEL
tara:strand:- start:1337 stop:1843 length:507 start_codon:yes stop_codon:yes gene_type:complete